VERQAHTDLFTSSSPSNTRSTSPSQIARPEPDTVTKNLDTSDSLITSKIYLDRIKHSKRIATRFDIKRIDDNVEFLNDSDFMFVDELSLDTTSNSCMLSDKASSIMSPVSTVQPMICVCVIKAWDLPETLADTNPFVIIDWGGTLCINLLFLIYATISLFNCILTELGVSRTQVVEKTTSPKFDSDLRFRCPITTYPHGDSIDIFNSATIMPKIRISVYSKNSSISDELLGCALLDAKEFFQITSGSKGGYVNIFSFPDGNSAGVVEFKAWVV